MYGRLRAKMDQITSDELYDVQLKCLYWARCGYNNYRNIDSIADLCLLICVNKFRPVEVSEHFLQAACHAEFIRELQSFSAFKSIKFTKQ